MSQHWIGPPTFLRLYLNVYKEAGAWMRERERDLLQMLVIVYICFNMNEDPTQQKLTLPPASPGKLFWKLL